MGFWKLLVVGSAVANMPLKLFNEMAGSLWTDTKGMNKVGIPDNQLHYKLITTTYDLGIRFLLPCMHVPY